ncbi:Bro-N domain-containing protein [Candidatus Gracilibacteria bacterium]|nr:Bro-N domain-containing protein [Candidatus Gracilibacteria bacterium]
MAKDIKSQKIALFEGKEVRKTIYKNEWFFSVVDVVGILSESSDARKYWNKLAERLRNEGSELVTICHQLKLESLDGKKYATDCANTEGILRIIQSIPSPKAEPFKRWLAQVGYERIQEIENPELAMMRMTEIYEKKGYPKEWVDVRIRGISVRKDLTDEWDERGGELAYGILTNEVYKAYSGMTNEQWKKFKGMEKGNLRDGMTPTELILTMLAEQATKDITKSRRAEGLPELKKASKDGGGVAFKARKELKAQTGTDPISKKNYLKEIKEEKNEIGKKTPPNLPLKNGRKLK